MFSAPGLAQLNQLVKSNVDWFQIQRMEVFLAGHPNLPADLFIKN